MSFLKDLLDTFVPHEKNGYKPHFFRVRAFLILVFIIVVLGVLGIVLQKTILERSDYLAAVIASAVIDFTNGDRAAENIPTLLISPSLERAAQLKAEDMALKGYFAHTSPDGTTPWHWFEAAGYDFVYAGENLAVRFDDSAEVVKAWMNSPGHRANILNEHFTEIGIGVAEGVFEGKPAVFVVQMFGAPAPRPLAVALPAPQAVAVVPAEGSGATTSEDVLAAEAEAEAPAEETSVSDEADSAETESVLSDVIFETESFVALKKEEIGTSSIAAPSIPADTSFSLAHKLLTSPESTVRLMYAFLAGFVGVALLTMVILEARHQHLGNVILGVLLLAVMAGLLAFGNVLFPDAVLVALR
jgi:hypothetical protein